MAAAIDLREHVTEGRLANLEGAFQQMNARMGRLEADVAAFRTEMKAEIAAVRDELRAEIGSVRAEIGSVRAEIGSVRGEISSNFRWTLGILIPMWISLIVTILLRR